MDLREKILVALSEHFAIDFANLIGGDRITGFVVSPKFRGVSSLKRQKLLEKAMRKAKDPLSRAEERQVLMIAAITPEEYDAAGVRVRVQKIKQFPKGVVEVLLLGTPSDAEYVRKAFDGQENVQTTVPKRPADDVGRFISFRAKSIGTTPLTKAEALRILKNHRYVDVMPTA